MKVKVKRGRILEDAYAQLAPLGSRIKQPLLVTFVDEHGTHEAGALPTLQGPIACLHSAQPHFMDPPHPPGPHT